MEWSGRGALPATGFVGQRARIINQIRGFMLERGIAVRQASIPTVREQCARRSNLSLITSSSPPNDRSERHHIVRDLIIKLAVRSPTFTRTGCCHHISPKAAGEE